MGSPAVPRVGKATAYRYFASQEALLLEPSLDVIGQGPDERAVTEGPVSERVDAVIGAVVRMSFDHEALLRAFLKHSMEQWLRGHEEGSGDYPVRKGRRVAWPERALEPLHSLPPRERRRLMLALSMLCGVEAMVVAKDIYGCTLREAEATSRWAAQAILRAATAEKR
jgi:hypothetical protein